VGGIALVLLVGVYSLAAPQLNARFGWNLPQIRADSGGNIQLADSPPKEALSGSSSSDPIAAQNGTSGKNAVESKADHEAKDEGKKPPDSESAGKASHSSIDRPGTSKRAAGPLADRMGTSPRHTRISSRGPPDREATDSNVGPSNEDLRYGLLREVSGDQYISPAGLLYAPGSAEGHRLEHLRRHTKDDPGRPGSHGVFDGDMAGALKTIDQAYERAKKGQRTTKKVDADRTIYTVDMGKRIGYVGGRDGGRRRNPMARRVCIVLEGNRLITAYPL
jgi:hypothetical protein